MDTSHVPGCSSLRAGSWTSIPPLQYSEARVRLLWNGLLAERFLSRRPFIPDGDHLACRIYCYARQDLVRLALPANDLSRDGLSQDRVVDRRNPEEAGNA